ncbi:MAG: NAD(P)/FAD-dependent oxidoreductase [Thaumarchaeota archaeon]|nr:NAD(P)/FAD-dependent oxidoreductase [Nitrososphaerota archaeon]
MESSQKPVDNDVYDITIIGAGPAGLFGAFYAGIRNMKTKIIDARSEPGGQLSVLYPDMFIYDIPGYPRLLAKELVKHLVEQASQFKPKMVMNEKVIGLTRQDSLMRLETDNAVHISKSVVICIGAGAISINKLDIPSANRLEGRGVHYHVEHEGDFRGKRVIIVGGGDTAVSWALTLKDWASKVTLIHRSGTFRAKESSLIELFHSNVEVKIPCELREVAGENSVQAVKVFNNKTSEEETIPADTVLIGIGVTADLSPVANWGLPFENNMIKINGLMETGVQGIFAAGDIAVQTGTTKLNLIATGFAQATIAVNRAKNYVDPKSQVFPGHSSEKRF